jgi:16S rRNA (adenine1518-N6/adenine1519-N6)-dimethyltransferase
MEFKYFQTDEIDKLFENKNLSFNKNLGQNFLIDRQTAAGIRDLIPSTPRSLLIEIGSGIGNLTHLLTDKAEKLVLFELDNGYYQILKEQFASFSHIDLHHADFIKTFKKVMSQYNPGHYDRTIICGNIPYHITREIFEKIFTSEIRFDAVILMVQKEMEEKIFAHEGDPKYSYFNILCNYEYQPEIALKCPSASFYPPPNVGSIVVRFLPVNRYGTAVNRPLLFNLARSLFFNRRKNLLNNLSKSPFLQAGRELIAEALDLSGIPHEERGENLPLDAIIRLADKLDNLLKDRSTF